MHSGPGVMMIGCIVLAKLNPYCHTATDMQQRAGTKMRATKDESDDGSSEAKEEFLGSACAPPGVPPSGSGLRPQVAYYVVRSMTVRVWTASCKQVGAMMSSMPNSALHPGPHLK